MEREREILKKIAQSGKQAMVSETGYVEIWKPPYEALIDIGQALGHQLSQVCLTCR